MGPPKIPDWVQVEVAGEGLNSGGAPGGEEGKVMMRDKAGPNRIGQGEHQGTESGIQHQGQVQIPVKARRAPLQGTYAHQVPAHIQVRDLIETVAGLAPLLRQREAGQVWRLANLRFRLLFLHHHAQGVQVVGR